MRLRKATALISTIAALLFGADNHPASQTPPGGLAPEQVPMFVSIGFDDNGYSGLPGSGGDGGMEWSTEFFRSLNNPAGVGNPATFDGAAVRANYYFTTYYISTYVSESPVYVKQAWREALEDGHEYGNHTQAHSDGANFTTAQWESEIALCEDWITKPWDPTESVSSPDNSKGIGAEKSKIYGFRSPYLHYNDNLYTILTSRGYTYDCSIEEGWQPEHDGTNYNWPYTLDQGSPGHDYLYNAGTKNFTVGQHPGLWEMPVHPLVIPPNDKCAQYGVSHSIRDRVKEAISWFDVTTGKLTALDYTMYVEAKMTKEEALATLKYTYDIRRENNRAPFLFGAHTDEYSPKYTYPPNITTTERREVIEEFVQYVLSYDETRFVPMHNIIEWMRNPVALDDANITIKRTITSSVTPHEIVDGDVCSVPAYVPGVAYWQGDSCSYDGSVWRAKWWINKTPGTDNAWENLGTCGGSIVTEYYGTISPEGSVKVDDSGSVTFTMTPEAGYEVTAITVDGNAVTPSPSYTFSTVTANHSIEVTFGEATNPPTYFDITATAGANGSISPLGSVTVAEGSNKTFAIAADAGYEIADVTVDGASVGAVANYTFSAVSAGHTINATFAESQVVTYSLTASVTGNGSITPAGATVVAEGGSQNYTIAADAGNQIDSVVVNGSNVGAVSSYSFTNVTANGTIAAYFSVIPVVEYTLTASVAGNGSITPAGATVVAEGGSQNYTIAADAGNQIDSVVVNGSNVGAVSSYSFTNVTANSSIAAYFSVVTTGEGGCADEQVWDANQNWTEYSVGDLRVNNGSLWRCINTSYSFYEPSSAYGYYGWELVESCN